MTPTFRVRSSNPYDAIADEYYDNDLHPTSRNFDCTTRAAFESRSVRDRVSVDGLVLDVGAGRGRTREFLGIDASRVIQLDSSAKMLALEPREESLLRVIHRAETLPFLDFQFTCVTAFLCDAFVGMEFLREACRVLSAGGTLVGTIPAYEWGVVLRKELQIGEYETRFVNRKGELVIVPSTLVRQEQLTEMLVRAGFAADEITVIPHTLPRDTAVVSKDIELPATRLGKTPFELPVLYTFVASR